MLVKGCKIENTCKSACLCLNQTNPSLFSDESNRITFQTGIEWKCIFDPTLTEIAKSRIPPREGVRNRKWTHIGALRAESTEYVVGLDVIERYGGLNPV